MKSIGSVRVPDLREAPPARLRWAAAIGFALVGWILVRDLHSVAATRWMKLYDPTDFHDLGDVLVFFRQLHTGIPPALSLLEILSQLWLGDVRLVTEWMFRFGVVLAYLLPFLVFPRTTVELLVSCAASLVFLWATALLASIVIHVYDVLFPLFVLSSLTFVKLAPARQRSPVVSSAFCILAGFFLSMAELSRPFMLFVVPFILVHAHQALKSLPKRCFVFLLIPLALFSGGWHLKLLIAHHGQIVWSNNTGMNLFASWRSTVSSDWPEFTRRRDWQVERAEEGAFRGSGRYAALNWNTEAHSKKSQALTLAVIRYSVHHPIEAGRHVLEETLELLRPKTAMFYQHPVHGVLSGYRALVRLTAIYLFLNALFLSALLLRRRDPEILGLPESAVIVTGCLSTFFLAVGESGEEARYVVTVLPFLAVLPRVLSLSIRRTGPGIRIRAVPLEDGGARSRSSGHFTSGGRPGTPPAIRFDRACRKWHETSQSEEDRVK